MVAELLEGHGHGAGGALCLQFTNTTSARRTERPGESLHSYADLLAWARREGVVSPGLADGLAAAAEGRLAEAAGVLQQALALREAIYRIIRPMRAAPRPQRRTWRCSTRHWPRRCRTGGWSWRRRALAGSGRSRRRRWRRCCGQWRARLASC